MRTNRIDRPIALQWITGGVLAVMSGALLALGCDRRDETADLAAADARRGAPETTTQAAEDALHQQLNELEITVSTAAREAEQEIQQAREQANQLSDETRERLDAAIDRTEAARDNVSDRLDELKDASRETWDVTRERVSDALQELAEARREVAASLRGETSAG